MRDNQNRDTKPRSVLQRISGLMKKFKNKERFKNAAYYTLSSENYSPKISSLFLCFRSSGLGLWDSLFNALYMYASDKDRHAESELKKRYGDVVMHPHGYSESFMRITFWSGMLKVMDFIPKIFALPSRLAAARRERRAKGENSLRKFMRTAGFCRRRASYILPAVMALIVCAYIYNVSSDKLVLNVSYDGKDIGTVENHKVLEDALTAVEETLSETTGVSVKLSNNILYSVSRDDSPAYVSGNDLYTDILSQAKKDYTSAYGLYIDGTLVASLENKAEIETVLDEMSDDQSKIANGIQILKQDYPKDAVKSSVELKEILGISPERIVMSSEASAVSEDNSTALAIIRNIPAPVNSDSVDFSNAYSIDDEKTLEIIYKTEKLEKKTVPEEFTTVYEYDPNMYSTSKYVKQQGKNGTKTVTEKVIYVDGVEESRTVVAEETVTETVNKIVVKGLKPIPESLSNATQAYMLWPIEADVNEAFGWRLRNGSYMEYHKGIDMSAPRGTPIIASASGVVEKAGYHYNGYSGYGKIVVIKHADGKETFYAHMNDVYVSQGDIVTQGTTIGEVGSTGDSTGYHIHFEIRVNGTPVDPLDYLVPKGE